MPILTVIDHVHIYVTDRVAAQKWYAEVLGFTSVQAYLFWVENNGPLTLENSESSIHLALFERETVQTASAVAFGTNAEEFMKWRTHLKAILSRHNI